MCEKRARKVKKGSHLTRLREARRLQRLQWLASPTTTSDESNSSSHVYIQPQQVDKVAQNRVILELAWRTIGLMHKNRLIQQKIIALQKETSDFVASVMNNPDNKKRYLENARLYSTAQAQTQSQTQTHVPGKITVPVKLEPKM